MVERPTADTDKGSNNSLSVVIPTYRRDRVLIETLSSLFALETRPGEIIVVDQTPMHDDATDSRLKAWNEKEDIRWIRLPAPSITHAMNVGLIEAKSRLVLFLDDDIVPNSDLIAEHSMAHTRLADGTDGSLLVVGRILQPWHVDGSRPAERFASTAGAFIHEFMAGNVSMNREFAMALGGFDEQFVRVAYKFEAEFSDRALKAGARIWFEPRASIHHLRASSGGTRSFGDHLRTCSPAHAVGHYYYWFRTRRAGWVLAILATPFRSVRTRFHLRHPWWIIPVLIAQFLGFTWGLALWIKGPKYIHVNSREY